MELEEAEDALETATRSLASALYDVQEALVHVRRFQQCFEHGIYRQATQDEIAHHHTEPPE
jgi:hypothetical protein